MLRFPQHTPIHHSFVFHIALRGSLISARSWNPLNMKTNNSQGRAIIIQNSSV